MRKKQHLTRTLGRILAEKVRKNPECARQPTGRRTKVIEDGGEGSRHRCRMLFTFWERGDAFRKFLSEV